MKYPRMDLGTMEAIVNKLGGMDGVRRFLSGELIVKAVEGIFCHDERKDGWTLLEDVGSNPTIEISKLEVVSFLPEGKDCIGGEEMGKRAKDLLGANLGQLHAEYLLERQNEQDPDGVEEVCSGFSGYEVARL